MASPINSNNTRKSLNSGPSTVVNSPDHQKPKKSKIEMLLVPRLQLSKLKVTCSPKYMPSTSQKKQKLNSAQESPVALKTTPRKCLQNTSPGTNSPSVTKVPSNITLSAEPERLHSARSSPDKFEPRDFETIIFVPKETIVHMQ